MQALPKEYIKSWLDGLIDHGGGVGQRGGITIASLSVHTGISPNTLIMLATNENARMGFHRQMLLSKVISQVENGEIEFVRDPKDRRRSIAVKSSGKPPKVKYAAQVIGGRVKLAYVDRPKPFRGMPSFRDLLLG